MSSDQPAAPGLSIAASMGLPTQALSPREFADRPSYDAALAEIVAAHAPGLVVLAGFMRIITSVLLRAYPMRVMNIHPALLPAFPGTHVWQAEVDSGVKFAGCTVHFVDPEYDHGPILAHRTVPVLPGDTPDSRAARVQAAERDVYPEAIAWIAAGRVRFEHGCPVVEER